MDTEILPEPMSTTHYNLWGFYTQFLVNQYIMESNWPIAPTKYSYSFTSTGSTVLVINYANFLIWSALSTTIDFFLFQ